LAFFLPLPFSFFFFPPPFLLDLDPWLLGVGPTVLSLGIFDFKKVTSFSIFFIFLLSFFLFFSFLSFFFFFDVFLQPVLYTLQRYWSVILNGGHLLLSGIFLGGLFGGQGCDPALEEPPASDTST